MLARLQEADKKITALMAANTPTLADPLDQQALLEQQQLQQRQQQHQQQQQLQHSQAQSEAEALFSTWHADLDEMDVPAPRPLDEGHVQDVIALRVAFSRWNSTCSTTSFLWEQVDRMLHNGLQAIEVAKVLLGDVIWKRWYASGDPPLTQVVPRQVALLMNAALYDLQRHHSASLDREKARFAGAEWVSEVQSKRAKPGALPSIKAPA